MTNIAGMGNVLNNLVDNKTSNLVIKRKLIAYGLSKTIKTLFLL